MEGVCGNAFSGCIDPINHLARNVRRGVQRVIVPDVIGISLRGGSPDR